MMAAGITGANAQSASCKSVVQVKWLIRLTSLALSALAGLANYTPGSYSSLRRYGRHITTSALLRLVVCLLC
ncbi:hypothetical protein V8C86DRAFT_2905382 [Haematococcus lacustris]